MVTYIKSDVRKIFVEFENELSAELYSNLGTTWEDYIANKWVKLSDEQVAFRAEHPTAKVHEVWNMEMDPVHVRDINDAKNEKKSELERHFEQHVGDFKYNGTHVWFNATDRLAKKNEAEIAKNSGVANYKVQDAMELPVKDAINLFDSMSSREFECNHAVDLKKAEIEALDDMEAVDAVDVADGFPAEVDIDKAVLDKQNETAVKNNMSMQAVSLVAMQINSFELTNEQALSVKLLYPQWNTFIGKSLKQGMRVLYDSKLYNVRQEVATVLENQYPSINTAALYEEINETNAGTFDDPIPYNNNMELFEGKYYIQDDVIYKCTRSTGQAVYHSLSELVGIYVEVATEE